MFTLRPVRFPDDRAAILTIDRSFTTDRIYRVARTADSFALSVVPVQPPLSKDFPLVEDMADDRGWRDGLVAVSADTISGFAAFTHQEWNRRTDLLHLYVAPLNRGQGIGRALVAEVIALARQAGMRCVSLETSSHAYPAIQFYRRLGFELSGLDTSRYDGEDTALFYAYRF